MSLFPVATAPTTIGGTIATPTSTTLAALDIGGLPIGTEVWNADVGAYFKLTVSTAALVTDSVVAVKDTTGSRWIVVAGGGGVADGVSIDGEGTEAEPFSVIPEYIQGLVGGGWTQVDVVGNEQDVDLTFDGELGTLELVGIVPNNNAAGSTLSLQPMVLGAPVTTDQTSEDLGGIGSLVVESTGAVGAGSMFSEPWTVLILGFAPASGSTLFTTRMITQSGTARAVFGSYISRNSSNAITNTAAAAGAWQETASAMTGARIHSDRADGIKAGSRFLWRVIPAAV